jgi:ubiquinone/menaquinone biosynthesis C-methylase UbiE
MLDRDPGWLRAHSDDEDPWPTWEVSPLQQVDFTIHIHYLREYLHGGERVLEVGAGAGRFTRELAQIGARIVVVDISEDKLQRNRRNAEADGYADAIEDWCQCDMVDLSDYYADGEFDAVV